jgi:predicted nuclease with TOPRIM domain
MNNMTNKVEEIKATVEEAKALCMKLMAENLDLADVAETPIEAFATLQLAMRLLNQTMDLATEQAKMMDNMGTKIDSMDQKLDKIQYMDQKIERKIGILLSKKN